MFSSLAWAFSRLLRPLQPFFRFLALLVAIAIPKCQASCANYLWCREERSRNSVLARHALGDKTA